MAKRANGCSRFREGTISRKCFLVAATLVPHIATAAAILNRNRFHPVNRVLEHEEVVQGHYDFVRQHRVRRDGANVEKK